MRISKAMTAIGTWIVYLITIPWTWTRLTIHNTHGILRVLDLIHWRPMPPGLIDRSHPWATGREPGTGQAIWPKNMVYRSARQRHIQGLEGFDCPASEPDEAIVSRIGEFLAAMVAKSTITPELPWGRKRRMPHGINYIHGAVHYNGGFLLFNDFTDAYKHFSDPAFVKEVRRFAKQTRREVVLIFRTKEYELLDYAYLVAFLRTMMPWFCNCNGPRTRVLWGNPSPYPVVNVITGNWIHDTYALKTEAGRQGVVREPIAQQEYFQAQYCLGTRSAPRWPEKLLAVATYFRIRLRGERGGLFFVNRKRLLAETLARRREGNIAIPPIARTVPDWL